MAILYVGIDLAKNVFAGHGVNEAGIQQAGCDIRTVQELLGHADVKTTMAYTRVLNKGGRGVLSPYDRL